MTTPSPSGAHVGSLFRVAASGVVQFRLCVGRQTVRNSPIPNPTPSRPFSLCVYVLRRLTLRIGQFLAVAWDDGSIGLLSVENTKVVHRITVADVDTQPTPIAYIAWAQNLTGKQHFGRHGNRKPRKSGLDLNELASEDARGVNNLVDLPHALTFLEIDSSLPKISPLPVSGGTGDDMFVFSTTASLESMFAPPRTEDNNVVDIMIAATRDGDVHLSIYDSFPIGSFKVPIKNGPSPSSSQEMDGTFELVLHASHPEVSTHALLMRSGEQEKDRSLYLVPMDLRFVSYSPVDLGLLASKTTTLQKLLRYMLQTQTHIRNEWQTTRELPRRFLNIVQEDLASMETGPTDIVQALYHTVLTGHVYQPVRDWLIDSIGDRVSPFVFFYIMTRCR